MIPLCNDTDRRMSESATTIDCLLAEAREKIAGRRLGEAAALLADALALRPGDPVMLHTLGLIACEQGEVLQGADYFRRVLAQFPDHAEAHGNLGLALAQLGRHEEAVAAYRQCLALKPGVAAISVNLGRALVRLGKNDEAVAAFEQGLAIDPASIEALCGLGSAAFAAGAYAKSADSFRAALRLRPQEWAAAFGLGNALLQQGKIEDAIAAYRQAAQMRPDSAQTLLALAAASFVLGRLADAIGFCANALAQDPGQEAARVNLAIYKRYACDWQSFAADQALLRDQICRCTGLVPPFAFLHSVASAAEQLRCAQQAAEGLASRATPLLAQRGAARGTKIRLGYLSADFRAHATSHLIAELFELHERSRFDVVGYSLGSDDGSAIRRRIIAAFDGFVDLRPLPSAAAAQRIRDDGIEILVDLNGYAQNGRPEIAALRPAPVQVSYLGYPGTIGARFIDYIIVDPVVVPEDQQPFFSEKLVHLPLCYQVNDRRRAIADAAPSRADCGLPETGFIFCCFNNPSKLTPTFFELWMRLLRAHPASVLWLLRSNEPMAFHLRREAGARGIAPDRLVFAPPLPLAEHLARHRQAGLFLDTLPYGAHTTMSDALWAGLPAVTCVGDTFPGRVGASLLRAAGLPELVTGSLADYESLASRLAAQPAELAALRERLQRHRATAPLFDTSRFTRHIEAAYRRMWEIHRAGAQPAAFAVPAEAAS